MAEEPSLPRLPAVSWDEQSQSFSNNPRKRGRDQRSRLASPISFNSSDPAVFSSDDDPALDNYVEGRRKKRYVGSWFQQSASANATYGDQPPHAPNRKRTFTRQVDSGVFLGSDGTDNDDFLEALDVTPRPKLPQLDRPVVRQYSQAEQLARTKIQHCLEHGEETIDLLFMGLEELSNDTISPLTHFSHIPFVQKDVAFEQKTPELKLYLANNRLMRVPGAIFDVTHLTILTLRGNKLRELPPSIFELHNLEELNISQNKLRYLPIELLDLFEDGSKLKTLTIHPNPFLQPDQEPPHSSVEGDQSPSDVLPTLYYHYKDADFIPPRLVSRYLGRSPLQISNTSGKILSKFRLSTDPATKAPVFDEADETAELPSSLANAGRIPSLVEAVLRVCYRSSQLNEMKDYIPDGLANLRQMLDRTIQQKEAGGVKCHRGCKSLVVPTLEWIEWRELRTFGDIEENSIITASMLPMSKAEGERSVPFLRRGCSMLCGPQAVDESWGVPKGFRPPTKVRTFRELESDS